MGRAKEVERSDRFKHDHVQSVIPIKRIYKGMIITNDDRYVRILEFTPINFSLRSAEEQNNIIYLFNSWLRVSPVKMQFKVITRKADTSTIIEHLYDASADETNMKCKELVNDHIRFIKRLAGKEALTRRYFLAFEYEPTSNRKRTLDEIAYELQRAVEKIRAGLSRCGNELIETDNPDYNQAEILYMFYNRKSCIEEDFADRVTRVTTDTMTMMGLKEGVDDYPEIPIADYIAPRGIDFTHPDYYICDGVYTSILMVTKEGYPTSVYAGWMSSLIESGDGIDVDVILRKENRTAAKERVALKMKLNRIKASDRSDIDMDYEQLHNAIMSAQYIKQALSAGEDLYKMCIFISVSADTLEGLTIRLEQVNDYLYSRDIEVRKIQWRLEDAFQVVCPVLSYKKDLFDAAGRNVMTSGAASTYMMTSAEICDDYGIVMGINSRYQSLVNMDIFNTKKYKNANMLIVGTSGAGKTYTELLMALRMRMQRIQTFIISPDKAHEFKRACAQIGGSYIRISSGSNDCINIMEIRPEVNPIAEYLDESDMEAGSWLAKKATQLITFFHLLIPDLSNEEEQLADEAIIKTYNRYGITHDNKSIYKEDGSPRLMPIIGDLHQTLAEREEMRRVANILARFVSGSAQSFNRRTNVDLDNKFIVFDLQDLSGNLKSIGMFVVMDFLWSRIKEDRTERKAIFIDEAWQLIGASTDKSVADFVHRIFKIIRGYGGAAILATQDVSDLFAYQDGKFGKAILSNSKTKIILQLEQVEAEALQNSMELSKAEIRDIINFERGQAMICSNNNKVPVRIRASTVEHELITTDPTQLRAIVEKRKREVAQPVPVAPQVSQEPSPDGEEIVDTGYDKKLEDEKRERAKKAAKEAAVLEAQAVEQIADNRYAQMPTGERIPVEGEAPLLPTDDIYEDADVEEDSPGAQMPIHAPVDAATKPLYQGDFDRDLADAEDGGEEETERSVQYGNHPPIDF